MDALRPIDYNGHVPEDSDAVAGAAASMAALEQTARDALARLDAILARIQ